MGLYTVSLGNIIQSQDINQLVSAFGAYAVANVKLQYNAAVDGTTDDITPITNAISATSAAGGGVVFIPGKAAISTPVNLNSQNIILMSIGPGGGLVATSSFTGTSMINITADGCGVRDMKLTGGPNTSSATNPATNGIQVTGARLARLQNLQMYYINGWAIESIGTASVNNVGSVMDAIHMNHTAQGIHLKGVSGSNYVGQMFLSNIHPEAIDNGDGLFIEDINDVAVTNFDGAVVGGSTAGSMIHILGHSASHFFSNIDVGALTTSTVSPAILIETGANGDPSNVTFVGSIAQHGLTNVLVSAGADIKFTSMRFMFASTDGVQLTGGSPISFEDCTWSSNNQSNSTAYDINASLSSGNFYVKHSNLTTGTGSGVGLVTNPVNDTTHKGYFFGTAFSGSGISGGNAFSSGGTAFIVRNCPGYNPRGNITSQTIGASPFTGTSSQNDIQIIFTAINGMTAFKIGAVSIGSVPVVGVPYRIPARQSFEIDWATTAPTYLWFAD